MRLLSAKDIAAMTGWHLITIYAKAKTGEIPGRLKIGARTIRFRETEIERWLRSKELTDD